MRRCSPVSRIGGGGGRGGGDGIAEGEVHNSETEGRKGKKTEGKHGIS